MAARGGMAIGAIEHPVRGVTLNVGDPAPDFILTANDWTKRTLADYAGKIKIFSIVPSLDTHTCASQTRRFNKEASALAENTVVLTVSADLPYAQRRWCSAEGIDRVETLSDHFDMNFSDVYGVHVYTLRICQRAVFVVDQHNIVRLSEYVPVIGNEIDFEAALAKARELV
jgi:thioredoxin-dependent peroxiredoxin